MDCWEREHDRVLHEFRRKMKYCNNYASGQKENKKSHKNIYGLQCPYCHSYRIEKKGIRKEKQRYYCKNCSKNWTIDLLENIHKSVKKERDNSNYKNHKNDNESHANDDNILSEKIIKYLQNNPGVKARTIARKLGVTRKEVNSLLYGKLKGKCVSENYYWDVIWQLKKKIDYNFIGECTIETIKAYIENKGAKYKPIVFYYRDDLTPRIIREYFIDGQYLRVKTDEGQLKTFLLNKIRKVE